MSTNEEIYSVALSICSSPTLNQIWDFISVYTPYDLYGKLSKIRKLTTQGFIQTQYPDDPLAGAEKICNECIKKNIRILTYWDEQYPKFLKEIPKPPVVLYCKGNLTENKSIAIVGTRKSDKKSSDIARRLSSELSQAGFTIVSGMAIGIDREAHLGALKNNGATIGVLANGIDIVYPVYNKDVYSSIFKSEKSCIISEYPPGIFAGKWTFVRRNRIISGLSLGTVVVKAGEQSGALITAHHALEQNREVFVCPGVTFDSSYDGCNKLIKNGAILVSNTGDILRELSDYIDRIAAMEGRSAVVKNKISDPDDSTPDLFQNIIEPADNPKEKYQRNSVESKILDILSNGETDIDSIIRLLEHDANEINEAIVLMELSSDISRSGNIISKF
jgi:DNA processing protein